jgi:hypothetical protein
MYPYLEKFSDPKAYKIFFTGKLPLKEEVPKPPPPPPPKEEKKSGIASNGHAAKISLNTAAADEDKFRLVVNDGTLQQVRRILLGEVVAMSYKGKIMLVTADENHNLLII